MTMDESLPSVGAVPPNLREDLERREIEVSIVIWNSEVAKSAHSLIGHFFNNFSKYFIIFTLGFGMSPFKRNIY